MKSFVTKISLMLCNWLLCDRLRTQLWKIWFDISKISQLLTTMEISSPRVHSQMLCTVPLTADHIHTTDSHSHYVKCYTIFSVSFFSFCFAPGSYFSLSPEVNLGFQRLLSKHAEHLLWCVAAQFPTNVMTFKAYITVVMNQLSYVAFHKVW